MPKNACFLKGSDVANYICFLLLENKLLEFDIKETTAFLYNYDHGTAKTSLNLEGAKIAAFLR